jgi:hypothetical protein
MRNAWVKVQPERNGGGGEYHGYANKGDKRVANNAFHNIPPINIVIILYRKMRKKSIYAMKKDKSLQFVLFCGRKSLCENEQNVKNVSKVAAAPVSCAVLLAFARVLC